MTKKWWKNVIAYQIYPRSFYDSNHDGIGDLRGIIQRLAYLHWLGIELIWLSPVYKSPMDDNGYDISDYYAIDPLFGNSSDMEELIAKASSYGMKIMMDLVVNHCSDEHPWFQKALADPDCEEASYFIFKPGDKLPNNWRSNFGGSVWEKTTFNRYYMHTFSRKQPDLNWENPLLRQKIYEMIRWWLDKGIAGFRVDAITFIKKDTTYADGTEVDEAGRCPIEKYCNLPGIGAFLTEMRDQAFRGCVTVAEAANIKYDALSSFIGDNGYFSMIFDFNFADYCRHNPDWSVSGWKNRLYNSQLLAQKYGWTAVFFENHDCPRSLNKYFAPEQINEKSAKLLATILLTLRGTPFIYQGQEIGMCGIMRTSIEQYHDVSAQKHYHDLLESGFDPSLYLKSLSTWNRDDSRLPFAWDNGHCNGFSDAEPPFYYEKQPKGICVEDQYQDPDSILSYYKDLISLRQDSPWTPILQEGSFEPVPHEAGNLIHYKRSLNGQCLHILANMSSHSSQLSCSIQKLLLNNYQELTCSNDQLTLLPFQAIICLEEAE